MAKPKEIIELERELEIIFEEIELEQFWREGYESKDRRACYALSWGRVVGLLCFRIDVSRANLQRRLPKLKSLMVISGNLKDLSSLVTLTALTQLWLKDNQIQDLSPLTSLTALTKLRLQDNQIQDLSPLRSLTALTVLGLQNNQIQELSPLRSLTALTLLGLANNQIQDLSPLTSLTALTTLGLQNNQIQDLSPLTSLTALTGLGLDNNQIQDLSPLTSQIRNNLNLRINGNPITRPPLEIVAQGATAISAWFDAQIGPLRQLNEVKVLLVGVGGAGKTSLVKALRGLDHDPGESQTHGINIVSWPVKRPEREIQVRLWDFGGQEIMHATHQFFMSHRSLYLLVLDSRKEHHLEEYWLKHIESFGGTSPILVVINKIDENPSFDVDRRALLRKYPGIQGFFRVSCSTREGVEGLSDALGQALDRVEMLSSSWPESWFQVKTWLEKMTEPYIDYDTYRKICTDLELHPENQQRTLIQFLNDLGVALYFPDLEWLDTHVLEPSWITNAVYAIITHPLLAESGGIFVLSQLRQILPEFPSNKYAFLVALMKKFELCYELSKDKILVPDLLPVGEPELPQTTQDLLHFAVTYHFLPRSILPRLMVNLHKDVDGLLRWRSGCVLRHAHLEARAVLRVDYEESRLALEISGPQRREYLAVILHCLRDIQADFQKIEAQECMRCLCPTCQGHQSPHEYIYAQLLGFQKNGITQVPCPRSNTMVTIADLLTDTFGRAQASVADVLDAIDGMREQFKSGKADEDLVSKSLMMRPNFMGFGIDLMPWAKSLWKRFGKKK